MSIKTNETSGSLTMFITGRHDSEEDTVKIDWDRGMRHNLFDVLSNIIRELDLNPSVYPSSSPSSPSMVASSSSKASKLAYLNLFTKLCHRMQDERIYGDVCDIAAYLGFFPEEVFCW